MKVHFTAELQKFGRQGEKTGWTYILIPKNIAAEIKPGIRRSFRVKGSIDRHPLQGVAMIPMGDGDFIIPVNAEMRKAIGKQKGSVEMHLSEDKTTYEINPVLITCLREEQEAFNWFQTLLPSHQRYYSKWIESAKTDPTRTKRIAMTVNAMLLRLDFGEMLRLAKKDRGIPG